MIARIWHAWAEAENADLYEQFLREQIMPMLAGMPTGPQDMELYRRKSGELTEFKTIMWFADLEAVRGFAGANYEKAIVEGRDLELLHHFDVDVQHYEVVGRLKG